MILNDILSRLRTDGYFTGWLRLLGISLWDMTLLQWVKDPDVSVESSAVIFWAGWATKGSIIRLPIDAASYPRTTESSAAPLRAPQKLRRLTGVKATF
jgi:hypothetical protein